MGFKVDPALLVASSEAGHLVHLCEISKVHLVCCCVSENESEDITFPWETDRLCQLFDWLFICRYNCNGF